MIVLLSIESELKKQKKIILTLTDCMETKKFNKEVPSYYLLFQKQTVRICQKHNTINIIILNNDICLF